MCVSCVYNYAKHLTALKFYCIDYTILEFSRQPGYLSLTQSTRSHLNISTKKLYIGMYMYVSCMYGHSLSVLINHGSVCECWYDAASPSGQYSLCTHLAKISI